jgi:hypothetical protein
MPSNMETRRIDWLLLVRQTAENPTEAEWDRFLELLRAARPQFEQLKILVATEGGGPSTLQRERLEKALAGKPVRVAVVSDSVKVRFITSMIALFHKELRSFLKSEFRRACAHLGMTRDEVTVAERTFAEMGERLAPSPSSARRQ